MSIGFALLKEQMGVLSPFPSQCKHREDCGSLTLHSEMTKCPSDKGIVPPKQIVRVQQYACFLGKETEAQGGPWDLSRPWWLGFNPTQYRINETLRLAATLLTDSLQKHEEERVTLNVLRYWCFLGNRFEVRSNTVIEHMQFCYKIMAFEAVPSEAPSRPWLIEKRSSLC